MSSYRHTKLIRCKVNMDKIEVSSLWELEEKFPDLFDMSTPNHFEIAPTEEEGYLDYVLKEKFSYGSDEWGKARYLTDNETNKYLPLFEKIYPAVKREDLRAVEFCWYDGCEAPLYYNVDEEEWL